MTENNDDLIVREPPRKPRPLPSEGMVAAVCCAVAHMGQDVDDYDAAKEPRLVNKVRFFFEIAEAMPESAGEFAGRQFMLSTRNINITPGEKGNLFKFLKPWLGKELKSLKDFNLASLKGRTCMLNIEHGQHGDGPVYANIVTANPLPAGMPAPKVTVDKLPEWVDKEKAKLAEKVARFLREQPAKDPAGGGFDEIPF